MSTQTLSEADQRQVRVCNPEARAQGPPGFGEVLATRALRKGLQEPNGEPAVAGAGPARLELGTWQGAPTTLHKRQLLWLTSRGPWGLPPGTGHTRVPGQSALHPGFGPEQRAVTPPPGKGDLKPTPDEHPASTCWASCGGRGGPLWLGAGPCVPIAASQSRDPRSPGGGRSRSAPFRRSLPGDPLDPCEGPRTCTGGSPSATRALLHCDRSAPCATLGAWGPTPG